MKRQFDLPLAKDIFKKVPLFPEPALIGAADAVVLGLYSNQNGRMD